ncbi:MAG: radical SAM protein [Patescibacteria group bacterium]|nr:radical SAM protein [Patescibacteria group bacterium]
MHIPSIPHLVHIETTYACNGRCVFCYNPERSMQPFDKNKIDRIVESIYQSNIPHVYLIGGEPSILGVQQLNEYVDFLSERSSITIVTNGLITLKGLSKNFACIGVPIHGNEKTHERHTLISGGYMKAIETIKYYVQSGFDVRCIPVLTAWNFNQIYEIIGLAKELNMESVFVDRFEDGGLGNQYSKQLKPSLEQFKVALSQMIQARDDFKIPVGFGTAIPYCLDERLISENMFANCGVGFTFAAVNPDGDLRICNQSQIVYGNVLSEAIEDIWKKKQLDEFRNLSWVIEPCRSCPILSDCLCGCKVDCSCSSGYCVDYAIRGSKNPLNRVSQLPHRELSVEFPVQYRNLVVDRFTKLNLVYKEKYLITRYQTIEINKHAIKILKLLIELKECNELDLVRKFSGIIKEKEVRSFISKLILINAISEV